MNNYWCVSVYTNIPYNKFQHGVIISANVFKWSHIHSHKHLLRIIFWEQISSVLFLHNQVVVGSFLAGDQHEQKTKNPKHDILPTTNQSGVHPMPLSDPSVILSTSPSYRGDNWSSLPSDSRSKTTDINVSVPWGMSYIIMGLMFLDCIFLFTFFLLLFCNLV